MIKIHETLIESLSHDGRGVARVNGKTLFVTGALPGETVTYQITHQHRQYDEAVVESIIKSSPQRVSPTCQHYETCGGCVLQHLDGKAQLSNKEIAFWQTLKKIGQVEPNIRLPAIESASWQYRHRARLHVQVKNKTVAVGFKSKLDPQAVIKITSCPILMPALEKLLPGLNRLLETISKPNAIKHIRVAQGVDGVGLLFHCAHTLDATSLSLFKTFGKDHHCRVFLQINTEKVQAIFPEHTLDQFTYPFQQHNHTLNFSLNDFTQVNAIVNERMLIAAKEMMHLEAQDRVGDLFSGLGNFSLFIASQVKQVVGAEYVKEMVNAAKQQAMVNALKNLQFETLNLEDPKAVQSFLKRHEINKLILDPPRAGARAVVESLSNKQVKGILYVSCHPGTLARDAKILVHEKKYTLKSARVIDMFPHTGHIEAMAWFER
jgi:23S rRNA (uracil1939-C5)-methyltransferase